MKVSHSNYLISANWQRISTVEILPSIKHGLLPAEYFLLIRTNHSLNDFPLKKRKLYYTIYL